MSEDRPARKQPSRGQQSKSDSITADTPLSELTVGDLLTLLGSGASHSSGSTPSESGMSGQEWLQPSSGGSRPPSRGGQSASSESSLESQLESNNQAAEAARSELMNIVRLVGASPPEVQMSFLKGLVDNPAEAESFMADPVTYSREHGVLLEPDLVRSVVDTSVFGAAITPDIRARFGDRAVGGMLDLRGPGTAAWPAAVAAIAAVVSAGAAVVSAVTSATKSSPSDLLALKGLGPQGIRIPGMRGGFRF